MANRPSLQSQEPIVYLKAADGPVACASTPFLIFMRGLTQAVDAAPAGFETVVYTDQAAAISTTAFPTDGELSAGIYRVSWAVKVMTPAGVSSDVQVTISWTWGGVTQQWVGTLRNGNLTTTYDLSSVPLLFCDASSPITFAVAYNSNPAAAMVYAAYFKLERLGTT